MEGEEFCGVDDSVFSFALPHPPPPLGTKLTVGSLPEFSLFKDGRLAGGGIRRLDPIFPRLCNPWRVAPVEVLISTLLPLYVWFRLSEEYFGFPAFSFILAAKRSDILDRQS